MSEHNIASSPIIPWVGGKRRLAKRLLPLCPDHSCYVEPFCGAAALFFIKNPAKVEVINDICIDAVINRMPCIIATLTVVTFGLSR